MSAKSGVVWCTQWLRIVRLRSKMAQFGLMHDLTTEIFCKWSNGQVPNLHIRYNMSYSTDIAILTDIYRWNASKNIVSKCMCHGCVTRCLYNTGSLINTFLPQHRFSHSKLSQLAQDGQKTISNAIKSTKQHHANEYQVSQAAAFYSNVMSHLCQGGVSVTICHPSFFPLVCNII